MEFDEWLSIGMDNGWIGPPVCYTHDGLPVSEAEDEEFMESDPCLTVIRVYNDLQHRFDVEANHSPSVWRKPR